MKKHKLAGIPVKVASGPFKDKYFIIVDYFVNQYQGKSIVKLLKSQRKLLDPILKRKLPLDDEVVFGRLYPSNEFMCMHDSELQQEKTDLPVVPIAPEKPKLSIVPDERVEVLKNILDEDAKELNDDVRPTNPRNNKPPKPRKPIKQ